MAINKLYLYLAGVVSLLILLEFGFFHTPAIHRGSVCTSIYNSARKHARGECARDELDVVLEAASMEKSKTVIIAVVNKAYVESKGGVPENMLDLFLESLWVGEETRPLINNLVIVATDRTAYERCLFRGLHCYLLAAAAAADDDQKDGSDSGKEKLFMHNGFIRMMWRRTFFLLTVLRKGYSFIYTDADVMWLRNPLKMLNINNSASEVDIQFSTDWYDGNPRSERNQLNTGFYSIRSTQGTVALYERWYAAKDNSTGIKEQDVMQNLLTGGALRELNITASYLDTRYFTGFCQDYDVELAEVVTVHATCCISVRAKVKDLTVTLEEWKRFKLGLPATSAWSSHDNCRRTFKWRIVTNVTDGGEIKVVWI